MRFKGFRWLAQGPVGSEGVETQAWTVTSKSPLLNRGADCPWDPSPKELKIRTAGTGQQDLVSSLMCVFLLQSRDEEEPEAEDLLVSA